MTDQTPINDIANEIARLRAELAQITTALHSYSDALTQLVGWAEDGSPEDGYLYALTEAKKVLKDFKVVGSEVERLRAELASRQIDVETFSEANRHLRAELASAREVLFEMDKIVAGHVAAARQDANTIEALRRTLDSVRSDRDASDAEIRRLKARSAEEIARLKEVLDEIADNCDPNDPPWKDPEEGRACTWEIARAALACRPQGERSET